MKTFIVQTTCFGFRNSLWSEGQRVEVSENELHLVPKHFVDPKDYVPSNPVTGGRPPINPSGRGDLSRPANIAMAPDTESTNTGEPGRRRGRPARQTQGVDSVNEPDTVRPPEE